MNKALQNNKINGQPDDLDIIPEPIHPSKSAKAVNYIVVIALLAVAIALGVFIKWSLASTSVLDVKNDPFPARVVQDPSGDTGGIVFLKINYCKNQNITGQLRISYVSKSREVFLPMTKEQLPKGCANTEVPIVLPLNLLKDQYMIKFHVAYNINPLRQSVASDFESQPFTVGDTNPVTP